ncbi:MAG: hypothetical protein U5N85_01185 [Arcicella sp.]|nr:hypothetical protein [Arcicella sp.]
MTSAQIQLEGIICERREQLTSYAKTPNAKDFYIQKENILLQSLTEIYNSISPLDYEDLWRDFEGKMKEMKKMNANFSGVQLNIRLRELGLLCCLAYNLYEDGI